MAAYETAPAQQRDHYAVLGVEPSASAAEITRAYRRSVRAWHPDVRPGDPAAEEQFLAVVAAYAVLRDPSQRAAYDQTRWSTTVAVKRPSAGTPVRFGPAPARLQDLPLRAGPVHIHPAPAPPGVRDPQAMWADACYQALSTAFETGRRLSWARLWAGEDPWL